MKVSEFAQKINLEVLSTSKKALERRISGVYVGDLLSWVMANAKKDNAWVTVHTHINIVAVAALAEISCIIIPEGIKVEANTIIKADEEDVALLSSRLSAYEICWKAHEVL